MAGFYCVFLSRNSSIKVAPFLKTVARSDGMKKQQVLALRGHVDVQNNWRELRELEVLEHYEHLFFLIVDQVFDGVAVEHQTIKARSGINKK